MTQNKTIEDILQNYHTIAVVGFSSKKERAGYYVPAYLQKHGYRIIPINPKLEQGLGERAYPNLLKVPHTIEVVLIFQRSEAVLPFVEQAIQIEAKAVWMQLGIQHLEAAEQAQRGGLKIVMDACMMVEHRNRAKSD
ncbi:MAG: CoA-binding protein [Proteobacteria bacterium]|nr:CoA-binding protein [Pseudomonadota bacterium]MBU1542430.1 CoA-binding protein [Pseudomonadota bacterium]MBU2482806.1 CoA-binding protein [Pseudomonadota bacterium]